MSLLGRRGGLGYLIVLAAQSGMQPFLTKKFVAKGTLTSSLVLVADLGKIAACALILCLEGRFREVLQGWTFADFVLAAGAPSLTYLVQNFCIQKAYVLLDAVTFNILNQTKTLFAAVFVFFIVGRGQTTLQCFALLLVMIAGILASQADAMSRGASSAEGAASAASGMSQGFVFVIAGSALSGLGAGLTEYCMTRRRRDNYLLSAELSVLGCAINIASLVLHVSPDATAFSAEGLFTHWSWLTLVPVISQGVGGMLVGKVTQVAGSVKKGVAITGGLVLSCALKCSATRQGLQPAVCIAVVLCGLSIYLHSAGAPRATKLS